MTDPHSTAGNRRFGERRRAPQLSVITPTFNEVDNVVPLLDKLEAAQHANDSLDLSLRKRQANQ